VLPDLGLTTVRLVLGEVSATADPGQPLGDSGPAAGSGTDGPSGPSADGPPPTAVGGGPISPPPDAVGGGPSSPPPTAPVPATNQIGTQPTDRFAAPTRGAGVNVPIPNVWSFYPIMVIGGIVTLACSRSTAWMRYRSTLGPARL